VNNHDEAAPLPQSPPSSKVDMANLSVAAKWARSPQSEQRAIKKQRAQADETAHGTADHIWQSLTLEGDMRDNVLHFLSFPTNITYRKPDAELRVMDPFWSKATSNLRSQHR
ncbi:hypothetical protein N0V84_011695, partial [Fusarium piperis]